MKYNNNNNFLSKKLGCAKIMNLTGFGVLFRYCLRIIF